MALRLSTEDSLREHSSILAAIVQAMADAVIVCDTKARIILANPAAQALLPARARQRPVDVRRIPWPAFWPSGRRCGLKDRPLLRALAGEHLRDQELVLRLGAGKRAKNIWVSVSAMPIQDRDGRVIAGLAVYHDITSLKAAREADARLAAIVDSSGDALYSVDPRGRLTSWNRGAKVLYGYAPEEVLGRPISRLWFASDRKLLDDALAQALRGIGYRQSTGRRRHRDGRALTVSASMFPIRDAAGQATGVSIVSRDVSFEKRAAEADRLRESERLQREFVANVSHELRTPVAAIRGFAETLLRGALNRAADARPFVEIIERHSKRLGELIEDLLHLSSIESGRRKPRLKPTSLEPLAQRYITEIAPLLRQKSLVVKTSMDARLLVEADAGQVEQVLQNLLANAIKFSRRGGLIIVAARRMGDQACVTVSDNGRGIPADKLPRIFQRFNRDHARGVEGGTGLGLSIAKEIVEAHGGRIWAGSAPGNGTFFQFTLPLVRKG